MQFEHVRSRRFVGVVNSPAAHNSSNHVVALVGEEAAGQACFFKIMPRFKVGLPRTLTFEPLSP